MEYQRGCSVHQLFEEQARRTPDAVALVLPSSMPGVAATTVSYGELDKRATSLAARLRAEGVSAGDLVAVLMTRSAELIVSMLGILKAGGAYVPLDPSYPQDRLDFILTDTNAPVCLTQPRLADRANGAGRKVLIVEEGSETPDRADEAVRTEPVSGDAPAYVIYTSGSTGRPKGVVVPHRGILRLVIGTSYARLDATRVILQLAPTSFDAATFEIWGALLHGGRCVLAPDAGVPDLALLRRVIVETRVTTVWLTASLFNTVMDQAPATLETVEEVLTGGEVLSVPHIRKALEILPTVQFSNGYGPTETTTFATCYRIPRPLPDDGPIPIGPPIANTSVWVLNEQMRPVPTGQPGDLYIGGDGVALGYLNRPELTAERFVNDIFAADGSRLYRTGDRARMREDGALEFLGRLDDQVKIRGHRIELGEIESVLREVPGVGTAVVTLREDQSGDKRLVAYYTEAPCVAAISPDSLRARLETRVPEYMIPSVFVTVDAIPLTPNGKADRSALPAPGRGRPALDRPPVAPSTSAESWLTGVWREVLQLEEVGVHDRFFELGGTSITALRLLARLSEEVGTTLPALLLFRASTIATLAEILEREYASVLPATVRNGARRAPAMPERGAQRQNELLERRMRRRRAN